MILCGYQVSLCITACLVVWLLSPVGRPVALAETAKTARVSCDLTTCIQIALTRHPELQVTEARNLAAQSRVELERAQWWPQLDFKAESGFIEGESVTPFSAISGVTEEGIRQQQVSGSYYAGSFTLNVPIVREGKILGWNSPSIRQARFDLAAAEHLERTRREHIAYRVTETFITVLKAAAMINDAEQLVKLAEPQYQLTLAKFRQDLVSRNDLLLAEVQLAAARRDLTVLQNVLSRAKDELARAMGLEAPATVDVMDTPALRPPSTDLPSVGELVVFAHQQRFEVRAQQAQINAKEEEVKRVRGERYPSVRLVAEYGLADDFAAPVNTQWRALAQITGPIIDFGKHTQKEGLARAMVAEEVTRMESLKGEIAAEVHAVYSRIIDTTAQLPLIDKQIEQAVEALKLTRAMFDQQLLPESSVAEAQKALVKLQQAKILADYELILAHRQLEFVTGGWTDKPS